jgi:hypothetical protein
LRCVVVGRDCRNTQIGNRLKVGLLNYNIVV